MSSATIPAVPLRSPERFFIDGDWSTPSGDAMFDVVDSHTEQVYFRAAEALPAEFTPDVARAREVAGRIRSGTVGHNGFKVDYGIGFGGFKQSGIGREGGREGLLPYLEHKTVLLDGPPPGY